MQIERSDSTQPKLQIVPCDIDEANDFVEQVHRNHGPLPGAKYALAVADETEKVRGVALVGRPCRLLQDGWTLEVTRVATDGCKNACSALYSAAWRAARAMGYKRMVTYIGAEETGTSVTAAWGNLPGFKVIAECGGGSWSRKSRPRVDKHPLQRKIRFEVREER